GLHGQPSLRHVAHRRGDLLQAGRRRAVALARPALGRLRHRGRGHGQVPAGRRAHLRGPYHLPGAVARRREEAGVEGRGAGTVGAGPGAGDRPVTPKYGLSIVLPAYNEQDNVVTAVKLATE